MGTLIALAIVLGFLWLLIVKFPTGRGTAADGGFVARIDGPGTYRCEVVGESHYQAALAEICGGHTEDGVEQHVDARLVLDDENAYDDKAVAVLIEGRTVGHLSKKLARTYRKALATAGHAGRTGAVSAVIRGGFIRRNGSLGSFGVWLDLPMSED